MYAMGQANRAANPGLLLGTKYVSYAQVARVQSREVREDLVLRYYGLPAGLVGSGGPPLDGDAAGWSGLGAGGERNDRGSAGRHLHYW